MRRYETIVIIDPDLSKEQRVPVVEKTGELIVQHDGFLVFIDEWGDKRLAYEIKKKSRGYYIRFDFCGTGTLVNEIERFFRIDDSVMKYMTVLLDKDADVERIKKQLAEAEASKEKAAQETTSSNDEATAAIKNELNDSEPEDKQDQPEISKPQAVESEIIQTVTNEEEK